MVLWGEHMYVGELNGMGGVDDAPGLGHRVSIYDLKGQMVCRFGADEEGEGAGQFIAPHGIAAASHGDIYVAEVSYTIRGRHMPPRGNSGVSPNTAVSPKRSSADPGMPSRPHGEEASGNGEVEEREEGVF